jgi:hypothetical protein
VNATLAAETLPRLEFDAEMHRYTLVGVDGSARDLVSVTTVLRTVGLINFEGVPAGILEKARDRGTRVHKAAQYLTEGTLDWTTVDESERGYIDAYARFLKDSRFRVLAQEVRLWDAAYGLAGTTDAVGWWDGHPAVADLKSGNPDMVAARYQLALYARMLRDRPPLEWIDFDPKADPITRISIAVRRDGTYRADVYTDPRDYQIAMAALTVYRAIEQQGGRAA